MRRTKCLLYMIILLEPAIIFAATKNEVNFTWSEFDERWDCVVGIAYGKKPIGTGVFIGTKVVITSANVIENYIHMTEEIKVYSINGVFNASSVHVVNTIFSPFGSAFHRKQSKYWVKHGFNKENSPVHDIYTLSLLSDVEYTLPIPDCNYEYSEFKSIAPIASINKDHKEGRYPFMAKLPIGNFSITDKHYMFAGFGFVDKEHIKSSTYLDIESYGEEQVMVDCDEWIPREWGYFICILNIGHTVGVPSGAPLFNKGVLVGIGSFTLMKNNQSIHVFTDLREYTQRMLISADRCTFKNKPDKVWYYVNLRYTIYFLKHGEYTKKLDYK